MRYAWILANREVYSIPMMCELLGVTRSGFYAWCKRQPSQRQQEDQALLERVCQIHADSRGFYGSPRVAGQLRLDGRSVGRRRVAAMVRAATVWRPVVAVHFTNH